MYSMCAHKIILIEMRIVLVLIGKLFIMSVCHLFHIMYIIIVIANRGFKILDTYACIDIMKSFTIKSVSPLCVIGKLK